MEFLQAQPGEGLVDNSGDFRFVGNIQFSVSDDINIRLIELPEPAPLGPFAPVDLPDLVAAEGERQAPVMQGDILCQRHCQIKAEGQVAVAF